MASEPTSLPSGGLAATAGPTTTFYLQLLATGAVVFLAAIYVRRERLYPSLPVVFLQEEKDFNKAKQDWLSRAGDVVAYGLQTVRPPSRSPHILLLLFFPLHACQIRGTARLVAC